MKNTSLLVRLSEEDLVSWKTAAKESGVSIAEWVREACTVRLIQGMVRQTDDSDRAQIEKRSITEEVSKEETERVIKELLEPSIETAVASLEGKELVMPEPEHAVFEMRIGVLCHKCARRKRTGQEMPKDCPECARMK